MSMEQMIKRNLSQTLVYWGAPVEDGYGGYTYSDPVEINGRFEWKQEIVKESNGEEVLAQARCYVSQDVDEGGYIYLGTLDDMDSAATPEDVSGAIRIISFLKVPALGRTDVFIRKASLNMKASQTI